MNKFVVIEMVGSKNMRVVCLAETREAVIQSTTKIATDFILNHFPEFSALEVNPDNICFRSNVSETFIIASSEERGENTFIVFKQVIPAFKASIESEIVRYAILTLPLLEINKNPF